MFKWSIQGNLVYFPEYYQQNYENLYESVFLNIEKQFCYRINELHNNFEIVTSINLNNLGFDEIFITEKLRNFGLRQQEPVRDKIAENHFFIRWFCHNQWYPK